MTASEFGFTLKAVCGKARAGVIDTPHGVVDTPAFMPVATQGSVKGVTPQELRELGADIILGNTYHLYLRPGIEVIEAAAGLHEFMGWKGPILTDSGGFQAFSLRSMAKLTDEAVVFRSHLDGSLHRFTPAATVAYQERLGVDVMMCLDQCVAADGSEEAVREAMKRTHRWAARCRRAWKSSRQALFGIVQGGISKEMRRESAEFITGFDFPGYAVGGLAVGETKDQMYEMVSFTEELLPPDRPRYLMGVGSPEDLVEGVARGMDMFDCALPTRVARNGALFTPEGRINITTARFRKDQGPVEEGCDCLACVGFSRAYLNHLFRTKELLGLRLASIHNLRFVQRLMEEMRRRIVKGDYEAFAQDFLGRYRPTDEAARMAQKRRWMRERAGG